MKQIVLIGDSIRAGYQDTVRRELADIAEVWSPDENGGHSVNVLVHLHAWVLRRQPGLVHLNCGLHDLKTIVYGGRENVVFIEHYRRNVSHILRTIREHTRAKLIWAASTPVIEKKANEAHAQAHDFSRYEADVIAYNRAAADAARELGVTVNDLYAEVMKSGPERLLTNDGVHFTPEGCAFLGKAVARSIRRELA